MAISIAKLPGKITTKAELLERRHDGTTVEQRLILTPSVLPAGFFEKSVWAAIAAGPVKISHTVRVLKCRPDGTTVEKRLTLTPMVQPAFFDRALVWTAIAAGPAKVSGTLLWSHSMHSGEQEHQNGPLGYVYIASGGRFKISHGGTGTWILLDKSTGSRTRFDFLREAMEGSGVPSADWQNPYAGLYCAPRLCCRI